MIAPGIEPLVRAVHDSLRGARQAVAERFLTTEPTPGMPSTTTGRQSALLAALPAMPTLPVGMTLQVELDQAGAGRPGGGQLQITAAAIPRLHTVAWLDGVVVARMDEAPAPEA